jgi:hypothetical protein
LIHSSSFWAFEEPPSRFKYLQISRAVRVPSLSSRIRAVAPSINNGPCAPPSPANATSAAPQHHSYKEQLIAAANGSGFHICYPLQGYANKGGINQPAHNKSAVIPELDAPNANGAYFLLGQMASTVLGGGNPAQPIVTVPFPAPKLL